MKCRNTKIYKVDDDKVFDPEPYHKQIKISIHGAKYLTNDRKKFYVTEISSAKSPATIMKTFP